MLQVTLLDPGARPLLKVDVAEAKVGGLLFRCCDFDEPLLSPHVVGNGRRDPPPVVPRIPGRGSGFRAGIPRVAGRALRFRA